MPTHKEVKTVLFAAGAVLVDIHELPEHLLVVIIVKGRNMIRERNALNNIRPCAIQYHLEWDRARWYHHILAWYHHILAWWRNTRIRRMRFFIRRASSRTDKYPPTSRARQVLLQANPKGEPIKVWEIEIQDLEDLAQLVREEGKIIIEEHPYGTHEKPEQHLLVIYDDYIE